ncbi:metalloregulator ArsR/SmtB family transcription factor [Henriciella sp.]|jgi:ArsR family transcriptional regulator|nr:metalloregulator ArsR/SmtB family transcription factor [Henriciella sp.]|tara:strand:+ start:783 stop:1739 length:957 start_codon:yes stop_codon:yes gene_type:complete
MVEALRAAGEPTRLRILALLRHGELSVGELVTVLGQSQPRLSHHLKALTSAGLTERLPEGAWVFYRIPASGWAGTLTDHLFDLIDEATGDFPNDLSRLDAVRQARQASAETYFSSIASDWDQIRSMHYPDELIEAAILRAVGPGPFRKVVDLGTGTGRMLTLLGNRAQESEGLDMSHQMLTLARAKLAEAGVTQARVRQGDVTATPFEPASADMVIVHQVLHYLEDPEKVVREASRILSPGGTLVIVDFAQHDHEFMREAFGHRRLGIREDTMKLWAEQAGLHLDEALRFEPPKDLDQGIAVLIWRARKPQHKEEVAA